MKTTKANSGKLKKSLIQLGIVLVISLVFSYFFCPECFEAVDRALIMAGWMFTIWITQWYGHGTLIDMLDRRISWIEQPLKRASIGFVVLVVYSMLAMGIVSAIFYGLLTGEFPGNFFDWIMESLLIAALISFIMSVSMTAASFLRNWKAAVVAEEKLRAEVLTSQYETLKNQVNPHFLFNSFNVLSDIVHEDPVLAEKFIHQLSKVYRYVLDSRDHELVELKEELEFIGSFVFLLKTRFEEALEVDVRLEPRDGEGIIPVALQLLIENAVKHNEVSKANPLKISIEREGDFVVIENDLNLRRDKVKSSAIGLENIRQRYEYFSSQKPEFGATEKTFKVKIPIIKINEISDHRG